MKGNSKIMLNRGQNLDPPPQGREGGRAQKLKEIRELCKPRQNLKQNAQKSRRAGTK